MSKQNRDSLQRMGNGGSKPTKSQERDNNKRKQSTESEEKYQSSSNAPPESRRRRRRRFSKVRKSVPRSGPTNPFLIFFLRMRGKKPNMPVTVIAKKAGKLWAKMTPDERKKYVDLANAAKKRRMAR